LQAGAQVRILCVVHCAWYCPKLGEPRAGLRAAFRARSNRAAAGVALIKAEAAELRARLEQCEAGTAPSVQMMARRRAHQEETLCRGEGRTKMLAACCPSQGGNEHHRFLRGGAGCDALPATCSAACAPPLLIE
jgi:hypothetical protein